MDFSRINGAPRTTRWRSPRKFIVKANWVAHSTSLTGFIEVIVCNCELIRVAASQVGYMVHQYLRR